MGLVIGMDEAGYGPNLGPLVVSVTVWQVPDSPHEFDFWTAFEDAVTQTPGRNDSRLHVADSKQVYTKARGLSALETSVLTILKLCGISPEGFWEFARSLADRANIDPTGEPWFEGQDLTLPFEAASSVVNEAFTRLTGCCDDSSLRLLAVRSDVVFTRRFNELIERFGSKGRALSTISLQLLRSVWNPDDAEETLFIADKHGGRNRYDEFIADVLDGEMVFRLRESTPISVYRVGKTELRFQTKAEAHLPVAVASMVCKYVRELAMILFNRYWTERVPELKPTKGYPVDARRFKQDISETQVQLDIPDHILWRTQ